MDGLLYGRTALITGAGSGIGRSLATILAIEGCNLILADRNATAVEQLAGRVQAAGAEGRVFHRAVDVTDQKDVEGLAAECAETFGGLNILVNNAGVGYGGLVMESDPAQVRKMIDTNLWGLYLVTRFALPLMEKAGQGDVVNMCSVAGLKYSPGYSIYSATKFAVRAFGEALRNEVQGRNIRVTTVNPGMTDTAFFENFTADGQPPASTKTGGLLPPAAVAQAIVFALKLPPESALNDLTLRPTNQER